MQCEFAQEYFTNCTHMEKIVCYAIYVLSFQEAGTTL